MIPASRSDSRCTLACIYCRRVRFSILLRHPRPWFLIPVSKSGHFSLGRSTVAQLQSGPTVPPYCSRSRRQTTTTQRSSSWAETTQRRTQQGSLISYSPLRLGSRGQRWHRHVWKWKPRFYPTVKCLSQAALPKMKMRQQQVCKRSSSIRRPAAFPQPEPMFSQGSITTSNCSCPMVRCFWRGGNPQQGSYEKHIEIYRPAYLFNSDDSPATRPTITGAPASITYGNTFTVQTPNTDIASVVLIKPGSVTHSFDMDQRFVGLSFTVENG